MTCQASCIKQHNQMFEIMERIKQSTYIFQQYLYDHTLERVHMLPIF
jgi:hypothetical protein